MKNKAVQGGRSQGHAARLKDNGKQSAQQQRQEGGVKKNNPTGRNETKAES